MKKLTIELTEEQHRFIKTESAKRGMTIRDYILSQAKLDSKNPKRKLDNLKGKIWVSDDFDEFGEDLQEMFGVIDKKRKKEK